MEAKDLFLGVIKTEKSLSAQKKGQHFLLARSSAKKGNLRRQIESLFQVKVVKINTARTPAERKMLVRFHRRYESAPLKKVMVTLAPGQTLALPAQKEKGKEKR